MKTHSDEPRSTWGPPAFMVVIAMLAAALSTTLALSEAAQPNHVTDWRAFGMFALLLLIGETRPSFWMRFGYGGEVTPRWAIAYALLLLGSPATAVIIVTFVAALSGMISGRDMRSNLLTMFSTAMVMSAAGLVLHSFGVYDSVTALDRIPVRHGLAIVGTGLALFALNGAISAFAISISRGISLLTTLRQGFAQRLTADAALLSLAPVFVIALEFSMVLLPLLLITSVLVFQSARQALQRSHEASHDPLTGLLNRRVFIGHLTDLLESNGASARRGAVLLMDLDGFKDINDRLGHQFGDQLLISVADRLQRATPPNAYVARLGGDEFALVLVGEQDRDEVERHALGLHSMLAEPHEIDRFPVSVAVSIGAAFAPEDGDSASEAMRSADIAMYRAKRSGGGVEVYRSSAAGRERGRIGLLSELPNALTGHQLRMHFQPQLSVQTGQVDTVEALLRWKHPDLGMIPPGDFMGMAEQTDLISPITDLVVRMSSSGLLMTGADNVGLAVNISARSLQDRHFSSRLLEIIASTGFPASRLELEVTERTLSTNNEQTQYNIDRLRDAGARFAVDDFGTGYASYSTLRDMTVDRIKIDRAFITNLETHPQDRLIVQSVINLAHDLGLVVVAEGVETTGVWDMLGDMGCDLAQGYAIARPMSFPDLRGWLMRWSDARSGEPVA